MSTPHPLSPEARLLSARDLAGLLAALAIVAIPHALRAPWWLSLLTLALYAWRVLAFSSGYPLPGRGLLLCIAAAAMFGVWAEYGTIFGRVTGITLLLLFSGLKLLETRNHRDASVAVFLCCFLLMTNFLYTQGIVEALLMCAALFIITVTVVGFGAPQRKWPANVRTATMLLAQAAPAALLLFLLFPRVQGPMWGLPQDAQSALTGLSDTMSPGNIAELAQSDALAFRAEFEGAIPPPRLRYWRGPALTEFDGRTWRANPVRIERNPRPMRGGVVFRYSVLLEPHQRPWLFALESPAERPPQGNFSSDGHLLATTPIRTRVRYSMLSIADGQAEPREERLALHRARRLPEGYNPKALELADGWRQSSSSEAQIVERAIEYFRGAKLAYTLEPPALGTDSVDEFLFSTKAGFCEHFASAFAFLMRAAGLPSRVVTGYLGGDPNPVDGILTLRQSDAHAWTEVYFSGRGWVRVDPTAAAVPARLATGLVRSVPGTAGLPLMMRPELGWLRGVRYNWEALVHQWNLRVLGYNPERQRALMSWLGRPGADWRDLAAALLGSLCVFAALLLAWSRKRPARPDPVQLAWLRFCRKLGAHGLARAPHEGPRDFVDRVARSLPAREAAIRRVGELYIRLRYGRSRPASDIGELKRLVYGLRLA